VIQASSIGEGDLRIARQNLRKAAPSIKTFVEALEQGGLKKLSAVLRRDIIKLK
jgi:hypothetical protein